MSFFLHRETGAPRPPWHRVVVVLAIVFLILAAAFVSDELWPVGADVTGYPRPVIDLPLPKQQ